MVSTRKKMESNGWLLSQLDDFDQGIIIGNTASDRQENTEESMKVLETWNLPPVLLTKI